ncbi:MAG: hypothetical protein AB3N64_01005 [Puniceicoccaceae bacterium]
MVSILSLWLPILVSTVLVFFASWAIHMFLTYHRSDFSGVPSEDDVRESLGKFNIPPGDYMIPHCSSGNAMKDEAFMKKMEEGPVALVTVMKNGPWNMGSSLAQWFIYCLVVSVLAAYIAGAALPEGAHYMKVFQIAGCTAFIGYAVALAQNSIWYAKKWSSTLKSMLDGLIYSLLTAGVFGWLWPGI